METLAHFDKRIKRKSMIEIIICSCLLAIIILTISQLKFGSVQSASMVPVLEVGGSVVYMPNSNFKKLQKGDIILYEDNTRRLIIHRVVQINKYIDLDGNWQMQYIVKGDNNTYEDITPVTIDNYRGRVVYIIHNSFISKYLQDMSGADSKRQTVAITITFIIYGLIIAIGAILIKVRNKNIAKQREVLEIIWRKHRQQATYVWDDVRHVIGNELDVRETPYLIEDFMTKEEPIRKGMGSEQEELQREINARYKDTDVLVSDPKTEI